MGVSSDTIRARPKAKQSRRHILPQRKQKSINIYRKQQQINSASLSSREDRVLLAVGELERVPALAVTSPVLCSLIIPDHERRALFFAIQSPVWQSLDCSKLNLHSPSSTTSLEIVFNTAWSTKVDDCIHSM